MPSSYEFKLPDLGEGVAEGEVSKWLVSEGDIVREDQPLVEVMTDKVNVEIPSPKAGKISKIVAKAGQVVRVGEGLVVFELGETGTEKETDRAQEPPPSAVAAEIPKLEPGQQRRERTVLATPATRKYASELGVDLQTVIGTGPGARITVDDVKKASEQTMTATTARSASGVKISAGAEEERVPIRGIRKAIAERMSKSAHTAALVTHVDEVDMTELVQLRNRLNSSEGDQRKNVKLTFLPLIIKAIIPALKEFPYINAVIDDEKREIVLKKYYNIGIATDTEQGLIVPVVQDADKKNLFELAGEIESLAGKARTGQLSLDEVRNSTFTLTNVGSIGGLFSTPLVNYPDVAILGIQRIMKRPVIRNDGIAIRDMMYLSLSFDHRVVDGAYAARFLNRVIDTIQDPKGIAESASN